MKKTDKPKKEQKPRTLAKRKVLTELTDQDLKQVQGGKGNEQTIKKDDCHNLPRY